MTSRSTPPRIERYADRFEALRSTRSRENGVGKSRIGETATRGLNPRGTLHGGRAAFDSQRSRPIDLSFSNVGRRGHERGGLIVGRDGIRVYYDRQRYGNRYRDHHHDGHHFGFSYNAEFFGGHYYPYGYASHFDRYYHRYPYDYVTVHDYTPSWTVYVDTPVVETVFVERPTRTVFVEEEINGVEVAYPVTRTAPVGVANDVVGPVTPQPDGQQAVRIEPQDRVPLNNEWLASGDGEFHDGRYEDARRSFSFAVLEEPRNGFASLAYGLVHFALSDYRAAADALRRGLSLAPDVLDRPIDIARQYGKPEELATHIQNVQLHLSARPDDASAWFVLGYVEYSRGDAESAVRALTKAASLDPDDVYAATLRDAASRVSDAQ